MLSRVLRKADDGGPPSYIHLIALPLILAGIGILAVPGFKDLTIHVLNRALGAQLQLDSRPIYGFALIILGLAVYVVERYTDVLGGRPLLALRHQSFLPLPPTIAKKDLPRRFSVHRVQSIDCDLYPVMSGQYKAYDAALRIQFDWSTKVIGAITGAPNAPVAYYGIVHIPLQFLAGYQFSTFKLVHFFELERSKGTWRELASTPKDSPLAVEVAYSNFTDNVKDVAIRISISYAVDSSDVKKVMPPDYADVNLSLRQPRLDAIRSLADVRKVCEIFRKQIDRTDLRSKRIHIFYSGPVSLGFALGQQISPTIHGQVHVYNYDSSKAPAYAWSIQMAQNQTEAHVRLH